MATSLLELAGLSSIDTDALAHAAETLFQRGDFARAARIYGGLEALDGRRVFVYRRALAESKAGQYAAALATLGRVLDGEIGPSATVIDALKLRAQLLASTDPDAAAADLVLAERLTPSRSLAWS